MTTSLKLGALGSILAVVAISCLAGPFLQGSSARKLLPPAELDRGPTTERQIALTFDAGGSNEDLPRLLRTLKNEEITATFFLTGKWADEFPACAKEIVEIGHVIGNHTWGHKDLTKLSDIEIKQEILRADDRFVSAFGCRYFPLFRAPYGEVDSRVLKIVDELGFQSVQWSIDSLDSLEPRKTASFIAKRILGQTDEQLSGAIVLMHVGYPETCDALPTIIHSLRERGFRFVPVSSWVVRPHPVLTSSESARFDADGRQTFKTLMIKQQGLASFPSFAMPERQMNRGFGTGGLIPWAASPTTPNQPNQP